MATARPTVSVFQFDNPTQQGESVKLPAVFMAPLRPDIVNFVHTNMAKNRRQAYALSARSGYQTAAESWGTGRAVSRIPRVPGGGTHRAGQAAFGNMCRGGGMFAPTKVWRRWHRKINVTQKRHAMATALAASAIPSLVLARGHRTDSIPEIPLVVSAGAESLQRTKTAVEMLKKLGCTEDLEKVAMSKKIRAGRGKMRNRRYTMRRGPLLVYLKDEGITKAVRNIPGVDTCQVDGLNLLQVAPGGTFGRLIVWTAPAFEHLNNLFGSYTAAAPLKKGYHLIRPQLTNADVARIINSDEIQSVVRPAKEPAKYEKKRVNPLRNITARKALDPAYETIKKEKQVAKPIDKKTKKALKVKSKAFYKNMMTALAAKPHFTADE